MGRGVPKKPQRCLGIAFYGQEIAVALKAVPEINDLAIYDSTYGALVSVKLLQYFPNGDSGRKRTLLSVDIYLYFQPIRPLNYMVSTAGFEPATPCTSSKCSATELRAQKLGIVFNYPILSRTAGTLENDGGFG